MRREKESSEPEQRERVIDGLIIKELPKVAEGTCLVLLCKYFDAKGNECGYGICYA